MRLPLDICGGKADVLDVPVLVEFTQVQLDYYDICRRNVGVQCNMGTILENSVKLDSDNSERRKLLRRIYALLIAQNLSSMLVLKLLQSHLYLPALPAWSITTIYFAIVMFYIIMYRYRHHRRYAPWQYIFFVLITLLLMSEHIISMGLGSEQAAFDSLTVVTLELFLLCLYTMQTVCRLTVFRAIFFANALTLIIVEMYRAWLVPEAEAEDDSVVNVTISYHGVLSSAYIIYETQLVFSGFHGYQLEAHEYIFATTNIFVDYPRVFWFLFRSVVLESTISTYRFLRKWCRAELC